MRNLFGFGRSHLSFAHIRCGREQMRFTADDSFEVTANGDCNDELATRHEMQSRDAHPDRRRLIASLGGAMTVASCGGGDSSSGVTAAASPAAAASLPTLDQKLVSASRFLAQATVGYGKADIEALSASTIDAWLDTQLAMPRPEKFWDFLVSNGYDASGNVFNNAGFDPMIWAQLMSSGDALRQRVGMALLNIWVVGIDGVTTGWGQFAMAAYLDGLWDNAFGNYRDLMESVSTSAAMASFLTFLGSPKANTKTGAIPDENYARELMQLFTIGLYELNQDGTEVLSGGSPIPTYGQSDVSQGARIWTGYTYASTDGTTPARLKRPLVIDAANHETGATSLLNGAVNIPAGTDGTTARKIMLDALFKHSNTAPFLARRLIQSLVTSNPSPAYVGRVAAAFVNNGNGVRGDMKAVIRAVLTDKEARDDTMVNSDTFGKLREPVLRLTHWARAFGVTSPTKQWPFGSVVSSSNRLAQGPGRSPSVFNWFRPGYSPPGTSISAAGLVAPEFQITTEPSVVAYVNYMQNAIASGAGEAKPDYNSLRDLASDPRKLLVELNLILAAGQISQSTIRSMVAVIESISATSDSGISNRIASSILLVMSCPEYLILR